MFLKSVLVLLVVVLSSHLERLGVRATTTSEPDVSSLITECLNILPRYPPPNQFACYRTRTRPVGPFQTCDATLVRQTLIPTLTGNINFTQYYLQTPGRLRGRSYNNRLLCRWNVECRSDQLLYMDVTEHNIEPQQTSSLFRRDVCVDYLELVRGFGVQTSCGFRNPYTELEPHRVRVEFRSNRRLRFPGVRMRVGCFNPELQDVQGCSPTDDITINQLSNLRQRRHANNNAQDYYQITREDDQTKSVTFQEKYLQYFDQTLLVKSDGKRSKRSIQEQIIIGKTAKLYFRDSALTVVVNKTLVKYNFQNIDTLHTYNVYEGIESFPSQPDTLQSFTGRGVLTVLHNQAFYVMYGMDLDRFQPNENETVVIRMLMDAEEEMIDLPSQDFIIKDKVTPRYYSPPSLGQGKRKRRQSSGGSVLEPEVMEVARRGANSCNAVLRGIAQSVLEQTN